MSQKILKAIIIDDELRARRVLRTLIEQQHPQVKIVGEAEDVPSAVQLIHKEQPNVVFSDIEMAEYSGLELTKFTAQNDFSLVFVTAYEEYAVKAFELSAVDYLLKPVSEELLAKTIEKLEKGLGVKEERRKRSTLGENLKNDFITRLALPISEGLMFVGVEEIMYLIAEGSYTTVVFTDKKRILVTKRIKHFEENLHHPYFFRCHRSYIINLNYVSQYIRTGNYIVMDDGFKAILAKERKEAFMKSYMGND